MALWDQPWGQSTSKSVQEPSAMQIRGEKNRENIYPDQTIIVQKPSASTVICMQQAGWYEH